MSGIIKMVYMAILKGKIPTKVTKRNGTCQIDINKDFFINNIRNILAWYIGDKL